MLPYAAGALRGSSRLTTFVNSLGAYTNNVKPAPSTVEAQAGDLAVALGGSSVSSGSGGAWAATGLDDLRCRELTTADLSSTVTISGATKSLMLIYRGAVALTLRASISYPDNPVAGFLKDARFAGLFSVASYPGDYECNPTSWTGRSQTSGTYGGTTNVKLLDQLGGYTDQATIPLSYSGGSNPDGQTIYILEFRNS